jgi:hypothetical protein
VVEEAQEFEIKLISAEHSGTLHHHIFFYSYEGGPEMDEAAEVWVDARFSRCFFQRDRIERTTCRRSGERRRV